MAFDGGKLGVLQRRLFHQQLAGLVGVARHEHAEGNPQRLHRALVEGGEFVRAFGISRTSVYELMKNGELPTVKVAGRRLIPRQSALRLLEPIAQ